MSKKEADEAFIVLTESELKECAEFGTRCSFPQGALLYSAREKVDDTFVILSGEVCIMDISTGSRECVARYGQGSFTGDIDLFAGRRAVVDCEAAAAIEAIRIPIAKIREMLVRKPELGERFWRCFQKKREAILQSVFQGVHIYGGKDNKRTLQTIEFLYRNGVQLKWMNIDESKNLEEAREIVSSTRNLQNNELQFPVVTSGKTLLFEAPSLQDLAQLIGLRHPLSTKPYDIIILGAGPSGLGAAVYAASEGLSTLVLDTLGPGGQAGASSKIENYAGFPNGISGRELARLTYVQALKFGAEFASPCHVNSIVARNDGCYELKTLEGDVAIGRTILIATGVDYRLLNVQGAEALTGTGLFYDATAIEATLCADCLVHVIGAGNSAGQAAMFLSQHAKQVTLVVRGDNLEKSMSSYLSERVKVNPKIKIAFETQVTEIEGTEHVSAVHLRDKNGEIGREETSGLFIFIGSKPQTEFLPPQLIRDQKGFVMTGIAMREQGHWQEDRLPQILETSMPGIFASGDCRMGTTKRVAAAIGDGALAVTCVHNYLATLPRISSEIC
jgi:thioredoxin reductase (NADPH)